MQWLLHAQLDQSASSLILGLLRSRFSLSHAVVDTSVFVLVPVLRQFVQVDSMNLGLVPDPIRFVMTDSFRVITCTYKPRQIEPIYCGL